MLSYPRSHTEGGRDRTIAEPHTDLEDEFRVDVERIRFSPYFSRLSAVTQVIPQAGSGTVVHNRLTHSLKVSAVARSIAVSFRDASDEVRRTIEDLGGCDPVVVQAAAAAHDLGHPPFGHLGEQVLDRAARTKLGLPDGFEGNAQTFRILTALDSSDATPRGLNLTKAVRAAVLKYPWTRNEWRTIPPRDAEDLPRGVGSDFSTGAQKFSAYSIDAREMADVLAAFPAIGRHQQTLECSVMDVADDIAYSVHDLDDFYRAGVLQYTSVSAELNGWLASQSALAALDDSELAVRRIPGHSLEAAWRQVQAKDAWIADADAFRNAVERVTSDLVEGLLTIPYDGGLEADRAVSAFTRRWIDRLKGSIRVEREPNIRSGHVRLSRQAWHDVVVLKFVHTRFVLDRPDLAVFQRGQSRVIEALVDGFHGWLNDPADAARAPRRLLDSVEATTDEYRRLRDEAPEYFTLAGVSTGESDITRLGQARAVIDYIASLTDAQAISVATLISGTSDNLWESGRGL
ncbi:deoxyguanosinetriphosphate triphosphohydrolase family protein [Mycetocola zhadangensis]|uniref:DNTP triphosphohydrolase n=1 Tax=Mycetocola zhadangensis TaxID=1164595 RepID=A0A3L7J1K0_9MICO|nr:dNTP triphosphohydrolase [Mycetocola zhadangensis]RLQ84125.1 dNTP triphosphohydrolase [Mycetocola zhadangensis]GGE95960.1 dGTPase [Mycetocola zhadangensis]